MSKNITQSKAKGISRSSLRQRRESNLPVEEGECSSSSSSILLEKKVCRLNLSAFVVSPPSVLKLLQITF